MDEINAAMNLAKDLYLSVDNLAAQARLCVPLMEDEDLQRSAERFGRDEPVTLYLGKSLDDELSAYIVAFLPGGVLVDVPHKGSGEAVRATRKFFPYCRIEQISASQCHDMNGE